MTAGPKKATDGHGHRILKFGGLMRPSNYVASEEEEEEEETGDHKIPIPRFGGLMLPSNNVSSENEDENDYHFGFGVDHPNPQEFQSADVDVKPILLPSTSTAKRCFYVYL